MTNGDAQIIGGKVSVNRGGVRIERKYREKVSVVGRITFN